jgi:hypothetical protein
MPATTGSSSSSSSSTKSPPAQPSQQANGAAALPEPYLHLKDRPYLLQPIELAPPAAPDNKVRPLELASFQERRKAKERPKPHLTLTPD